jgi:hypothetical protein
MLGRLFRRLRDDRQLQTSAEGLSDLSDRHALFGDGVIPRSRSSLLERQSVQLSACKPVHCRPTVASGTHISRNTRLASQGNEICDQALLDRIMDLRKANHPHVHTAGQRRCRGYFRRCSGMRVIWIEVIFGRRLAGRRRTHSSP